MSLLSMSCSSYEGPVAVTLNLRPALAAVAVQQLVNPTEFHIEAYAKVDEHLVAMIVYPSCTNYEGKKILVFENTSLRTLQACKIIDPHFVTDAPVGACVPVARFEPTMRGWKLAKICAAAL